MQPCFCWNLIPTAVQFVLYSHCLEGFPGFIKQEIPTWSQYRVNGRKYLLNECVRPRERQDSRKPM